MPYHGCDFRQQGRFSSVHRQTGKRYLIPTASTSHDQPHYPSSPALLPPSLLFQVAAAAERLHLPVIADEVYEDIVFPSSPTPFVPFASISSSLPVLTTSSLSKRYLLPGWRLGWLAIHDSANILRKGRVGLCSIYPSPDFQHLLFVIMLSCVQLFRKDQRVSSLHDAC